MTPIRGANPSTWPWTQVAGLGTYGSTSRQILRGHHSVAILLPDGQVFTSGHENVVAANNGTDYQIYYPPYLFTSSGSFAARDTIEACPDTVRYGLPFEITLKNGAAAEITDACLMAPSAPTHANDFNQRRIRLASATIPGQASKLVVSAPRDSSYAPPGYYMLFVLDDGVPSEAKWVLVERPKNSEYVIAAGLTKYWAGDVWQDRDFEVLPGGKLIILPGTTVHVKANTDRANRGVDETKVEFFNRGTVEAVGTASAPIEFSSYDGAGVAGEWYGARFKIDGCERESFGYLGSKYPLSVFEYVTIKHADYGVKIESFVAPSLRNNQFVAITNRRDIYLAQTDVIIPAGYWPSGQCNNETPAFVYAPGSWTLLSKTDVVASTATPMTDAPWIGVPGKVDFVANGPVTTLGGSAAGDSVYFVPEVIIPITQSNSGDDWGGCIFTAESSGSNLRFSQIGYAANPLYVHYPNGTTIKHCLIHSFADVGAWFKGSMANGAVLDSSVVDRTAGLNSVLGGTGIYVDQADETHILTTLVKLGGLNHSSGGAGIDIRYGKTFCETSPADSRLFLIQNCDILGPGQDISLGSLYSGIRTNWMCGSSMRSLDINNNYVGGWKFVGIEMVQTADSQLTCNKVADSRSAVDVYRDSEPTGTSTRFRKNQLQALASDANSYTVRTNNNPRTKLGPDWLSQYGSNQLSVNFTSTKFIIETDAVAGVDSIKAQDNYWFTVSGSTFTQRTAEADIRNRIQESPTNSVKLSPIKETAPEGSFCTPAPPSLTLRPPDSFAFGDPASTDARIEGLPLVLELGVAFPNPGSSGVSVSLAVPQDRVGRYVLSVYDLRGRRLVETIEEVEQAGRFRLAWDGRGGDQARVSSGIYFLRVTGPEGFEGTRKVTVLR